MRLGLVVDTLVEALRSRLSPDVSLGDSTPATPAEVPAVAVSVIAADARLTGVGGLPRGPRTGALPTADRVDLDDPTLVVGTEIVELLADDRRTLLLQHGPVVSASGTTPPPPLDGDDVTVEAPGGPLDVVAGDPDPGQVRVDAVAGSLLFGAPLPAAGDVVVAYHVGTWDVTAVRFTGTIAIDVHDDDGEDLGALTRAVAAALTEPPPGFDHLVPSAWGAATVANGTPGQGSRLRSQRLEYGFSFDREVPALASSGGLIRRIEVASAVDAVPPSEPERFDVPIGAGTT